MKPIKNIFMCLVHENQDCIIDLVRNLKYLDANSIIMLYNGGEDKDLFNHFPFEKYDVIIHPNPKPLKWGWLHDFAIDCMEYAIHNLTFDTITVVDSDQLACGNNYTDFISKTFHQNSDLGMLGQVSSRIFSDTRIDPAITAYEEKELWQPFLDELPNGKNAFLYWTFWPSTVFTYKASVALVNLFRTNLQLQEILTKTKIWASEEILLPTLTIALGFSIIKNPCVYTAVKYKEVYTNEQIQLSIDDNQSFWIHPILRNIKDSNRTYLRNYFQNYVAIGSKEHSHEVFELIKNIYPNIEHIEGWLEKDEYELLVALLYEKAKSKKKAVFLEIGSYCGKATAVIGLVTKHINNQSKIIAIDNFTGRLGAEDTKIEHYPPSFEKIKSNLCSLDLTEEVTIIKQTSYKVNLNEKIDFILIDGLHDYANVARDFYNFEKLFKEDALILFHDYCSSFVGVMTFVKELISDNSYRIVKQINSLIVLQKNNNASVNQYLVSRPNKVGLTEKTVKFPLVSCIMPTYNRSEFIVQAIDQFLEQSYPNKELIILDDSEITIESLVPDHPQIRYIYIKDKLDIGSKRNKACAMSKGEFIIHLDDDDFYAPDWIEKQLSFLINNQLEVTGLRTPLFYNKSSATCWQYEYPLENKPWVYGATLCYTKRIWESNPFPAMECGEDNAFVWAKCVQKIKPNNIVDAYMGQIHHKNTSPKQIHNDRWHKIEEEDITKLFTSHSIQTIPIFSDIKNK